MTPPPLSLRHEFKAAVHLNNTGVALLKNRCYQQGMKTLADAVTIISEISGRRSEGNSTVQNIKGFSLDQESTPCDIDEMVQKAARRLSRPIPSRAEMTRTARVKVLSDSDILEVASISSSREVLLLIRIEPLDFEEAFDKDLAAITLYNYGMAFTSLSLLSSSAPYEEKLGAGAFHMFRMAYSALLVNGGQKQLMWTAWNRGLLTNWLVLRRLVELARQRGHRREYEELLRHLEHVDREIQTMSALEEKMTCHASRAA